MHPGHIKKTLFHVSLYACSSSRKSADASLASAHFVWDKKKHSVSPYFLGSFCLLERRCLPNKQFCVSFEEALLDIRSTFSCVSCYFCIPPDDSKSLCRKSTCSTMIITWSFIHLPDDHLFILRNTNRISSYMTPICSCVPISVILFAKEHLCP